MGGKLLIRCLEMAQLVDLCTPPITAPNTLLADFEILRFIYFPVASTIQLFSYYKELHPKKVDFSKIEGSK